MALFTILAYFCLVPFRKNTKGKGGKKGRRSKTYFSCGLIIILSMLCIGVCKIALPGDTMKEWRITYWGEAIALGAFGFAWIVAGKYFSFFVDQGEALRLFKE